MKTSLSFFLLIFSVSTCFAYSDKALKRYRQCVLSAKKEQSKVKNQRLYKTFIRTHCDCEAHFTDNEMPSESSSKPLLCLLAATYSVSLEELEDGRDLGDESDASSKEVYKFCKKTLKSITPKSHAKQMAKLGPKICHCGKKKLAKLYNHDDMSDDDYDSMIIKVSSYCSKKITKKSSSKK